MVLSSSEVHIIRFESTQAFTLGSGYLIVVVFGDLKVLSVELKFGMADLESIAFVIIAFCCTVGSIALAIFHIYRHLMNYTEPIYQRYIVRIIFMVPVSFLSLLLEIIFSVFSMHLL